MRRAAVGLGVVLVAVVAAWALARRAEPALLRAVGPLQISNRTSTPLTLWGQVSASEDVLLARVAARAAAHAGAPAAVSLEARLLEPLGRELVALRGELAGLGLESALEKTEAAVRGAVAKLVEKHDKARVHQDAERVEDVRRVRAQLYPGEAPQERVLGLSYHAARVGERALVAAVLAAIEPWQWSLQELSL
jgi:hypothetical protein